MNLKMTMTSAILSTFLVTGSAFAQDSVATPGVLGDSVGNECVTDLGTSDVPENAIGYTINSDESLATFQVTEELAGQGLNDAIGTTNAVIGTLLVDNDGRPLECSRIDVDLRTLVTDESRRDARIQDALSTQDFPVATFIVTDVPDLEAPLTEGEEVQFTLVGNLSIHGIEKQVGWDATVTLEEGGLSGSATTVIQFADFEVDKPVMGPVMSIEDDVTLTIDIVAAAG